MTLLRWPRLGLRRELLILLPVTLFLLVIVSSFTLFAYRSAIDLLVEDRQREVTALCRQMATGLAAGPWPTVAELRRQAPAARRIAITDSDGRPWRSVGEGSSSGLPPSMTAAEHSQPMALGPDGQVGEQIVGLTPFEYQEQRFVLRLDVPAYELARQRQSVRVLTWVVLPVNFGLLVLALMFVPHFLRPYDTLVEQVQRVAPDPGNQDEITLLVSTVDKALAALAAATEHSTEDDIVALQRALGASLESGFLLLDQQGQVLTLNSVGADLLEVEPVDTAVPVDRCLHAHPGLLAMLTRAVATGEGLPRREIRIQSRGDTRTLGFTLHALRRDDGTVRGHLALFIDLTESQREAEAKQLATSIEQLAELAAGVAHELRNSLATLRGYLTLIERHPEEESITDYLQEIRRESDHLQRVLEDFLAFAQPESTRVERIDLLEILRSAAADPALAAVPVEIRAEELPSVVFQGDPQLLERAIRNLLHNAAQAEVDSDRSGPIRMELRPRAEWVEITIEDRGPGVPQELRDRLFQPFVTGRSDGVGLGLSLTHRIVTLHGGRVRLEDRAGGGTRAVLSFPIDAFV